MKPKENFLPNSDPTLDSNGDGSNLSQSMGTNISVGGSWNVIANPSYDFTFQSGPFASMANVTAGVLPYTVSFAKMPKQKPGKSVQEVGTPKEFLNAIEKTFGKIIFDLAANNENKVHERHFGPGSVFPDALTQDWNTVYKTFKTKVSDLMFLNPPFSNIKLWARKCADSQARVALLVPASVGSNWFKDFVIDKANVNFLNPRLTFNNHVTSYPKDLMLCIFDPNVKIDNLKCWRWK